MKIDQHDIIGGFIIVGCFVFVALKFIDNVTFLSGLFCGLWSVDCMLIGLSVGTASGLLPGFVYGLN